MTPLKQPIVVKIENIATAVAITDLLNQPPHYFPQRVLRLAKYASTISKTPGNTVQKDMADQLLAQGIDYRTWEPPQPLKVGQYEVTALEGGAIKVGCTTVSRPTLESILKLSSEAMGVKEEPEWPKYYMNLADKVIRFDNEEHNGQWINGERGYFGNHTHCATHEDMTRLTPTQARAILSGNSKDQPK